MRCALLALSLLGCSAPLRSVGPLPEGAVTGDPSRPERAVCWTGGWQTFGTGPLTPIGHHLSNDDATRLNLSTKDNTTHRLFRGSLPFHEFHWTTGDWQVTYMAFPARNGFVARYHVTNHGSDPGSGLLIVTCRSRTKALERRGRTLFQDGVAVLFSLEEPAPAPQGYEFAFDLRIEPGTSRFVHVATFDLAGHEPQALLEESARRWEKHAESVRLQLPDEAMMTAYHADRAEKLLGVEGRGKVLDALHRRLARRLGDALQLLADVPPEWYGEVFEVENLPTDFGPLSFRFQGEFGGWMIDLGAGCRPPGGFAVAVPERAEAKVDGVAAFIANRLLYANAGSKRIEVARAK